MPRPKSTLKAWIVEQRKARGWKSEELAARLDVSESTVRGWEAASGGEPSADNVRSLERLFGVETPGEVAGAAVTDALAAALDRQTQAIEANTAVVSSLLRFLETQAEIADAVREIQTQVGPLLEAEHRRQSRRREGAVSP